MRLLAAMILALALCACATARPPASGDDDDPFVMGIDAGRMSVFVDRINTAAELVQAPALGGDELIGVARSVRIAALEFMLTKERLCKEAKFIEQSCAQITPPRWLSRDPAEKVMTKQVRARIEEVQTMMTPLIDAACTIGKEKSGDGLFCSVE